MRIEAKPGTELRSLAISALSKSGFSGPTYNLDDISAFITCYDDCISIYFWDMSIVINASNEYYDEIRRHCDSKNFCDQLNKNKHPLENTLQSLKDFTQELDDFVAPENIGGWSLSNLPTHFWETLGECIKDIEIYIKKTK